MTDTNTTPITFQFLDIAGNAVTYTNPIRFFTITAKGVVLSTDDGTWQFLPWGRVLYMGGFAPLPDGLAR